MSAVHSQLEQLRPIDITPATSLREKAGVFLALSTLAFLDVTMRIIGFHRFYRLLRSWPTFGEPPKDSELIARICTAVDRASTFYFKQAWCLQRSVTAVFLLRLRGVEAELVIAVMRIPFLAHAWVEVAGRVVNDHPVVQQKFAVLERC